ncbi:hypothetical protein Barb7_00922 [Bacteroidales bacterium Barb7]|nr:hypothetical protein Barb7_00922 [Bacteroidales bacterium Barb7]
MLLFKRREVFALKLRTYQDKGCISVDYQSDLFNQIKLDVPACNNQLAKVGLGKIKQRKRKRIETLFS